MKYYGGDTEMPEEVVLPSPYDVALEAQWNENSYDGVVPDHQINTTYETLLEKNPDKPRVTVAKERIETVDTPEHPAIQLETPQQVHEYIVNELSDTELAQRIAEHPEITAQLVSGEGLPSQDFFDMITVIAKKNIPLARELIDVGLNEGKLFSLSFDRVVGGVTAEEEQDILRRMSFFATEHAIRKLPNEKKKTAEQERMVEYSTEMINALRARYDKDALPISPEQVRFIADKFLYGQTEGNFLLHEQVVNVAEKESPIETFSIILHELTHFGSYASLQVEKDAEGNTNHISTYRTGLSVRSRDGNGKKFLNHLSEAVTEELTCRMIAMIPEDDSQFGEMVKKLDSDRNEFIGQNSKKYTESGVHEHWLIAHRDEHGNIDAGISYRKERIMMFELFKKIHEGTTRQETQSIEETEEELFEMLTKAYMTGNILPFGRLMNDTFGKGKFREYGHLQTVEEQKAFIDAL